MAQSNWFMEYMHRENDIVRAAGRGRDLAPTTPTTNPPPPIVGTLPVSSSSSSSSSSAPSALASEPVSTSSNVQSPTAAIATPAPMVSSAVPPSATAAVVDQRAFLAQTELQALVDRNRLLEDFLLLMVQQRKQEEQKPLHCTTEADKVTVRRRVKKKSAADPESEPQPKLASPRCLLSESIRKELGYIRIDREPPPSAPGAAAAGASSSSVLVGHSIDTMQENLVLVENICQRFPVRLLEHVDWMKPAVQALKALEPSLYLFSPRRPAPSSTPADTNKETDYVLHPSVLRQPVDIAFPAINQSISPVALRRAFAEALVQVDPESTVDYIDVGSACYATLSFAVVTVFAFLGLILDAAIIGSATDHTWMFMMMRDLGLPSCPSAANSIWITLFVLVGYILMAAGLLVFLNQQCSLGIAQVLSDSSTDFVHDMYSSRPRTFFWILLVVAFHRSTKCHMLGPLLVILAMLHWTKPALDPSKTTMVPRSHTVRDMALHFHRLMDGSHHHRRHPIQLLFQSMYTDGKYGALPIVTGICTANDESHFAQYESEQRRRGLRIKILSQARPLLQSVTSLLLMTPLTLSDGTVAKNDCGHIATHGKEENKDESKDNKDSTDSKGKDSGDKGIRGVQGPEGRSGTSRTSRTPGMEGKEEKKNTIEDDPRRLQWDLVLYRDDPHVDLICEAIHRVTGCTPIWNQWEWQRTQQRAQVTPSAAPAKPAEPATSAASAIGEPTMSAVASSSCAAAAVAPASAAIATTANTPILV